MRILSLFIVLSLIMIPVIDQASAQTKIIKKNVTKEIQPEVAPIEPPSPPFVDEAIPTPPPPPAPAPIVPIKKDPGIFGWGRDSEIGAGYQFGRNQQGFLGLINAGLNFVFADPLSLGSKIGLSEDALEYKVGLGLAFGQDVNNNSMFSIPLNADSVVYFNEGSLGGLTPFAGAGLNLNLLGTDAQLGGMGYQLYGGILADFGLKSGKTRLMVGYNNLKVGSIRSAEGIFFSVAQPIVI